MMILLLVLLCFNGALQSAQVEPKRTTSHDEYIPIGIDDFKTNLEQLRDERRSVSNAQQRRSFILLCEAAEKVFADNPRVSEIRALKE